MIYIHIPFCKKKCSYCNFYFSTSLKLKESMLEAILKEIDFRSNELNSKYIDSLYFGGGTPSIFSADELNRIIDKVADKYSFSDDIEITLEANPDDLSSKYIQEIAKSSINRLSIGTQSFFDEDLKLMNRAHNSVEALRSIKEAQDYGFDNISIDLIYGSPTSTMGVWQTNLQTAIDLNVPHISSYALTVEPNTALNSWIKNGKIPAPKEEIQYEEFIFMVAFLQSHGFDHYEISNFAQQGYHSKHNSSYWSAKEYLGLGPSAHSYDGRNKRSWNIANNTKYIKKINNAESPLISEFLSDKDRYNEMIMIGLRTRKGVSINQIKNLFMASIYDKFTHSIKPLLNDGKLTIQNNYLIIPHQHWFLADGIAAELFIL